MKNYIKKFSDWIGPFSDKEIWKKLILIFCIMAIVFGITFAICWLLKELIWVIAALASIVAGGFVCYKIKKGETNA